MFTMKLRLIIATVLTACLTAGLVSLASTPAQAAGGYGPNWKLQGETAARGDSTPYKAVMKVYKKKDTSRLKTKVAWKRANWRHNPPTVKYYKYENGPVRKICGQHCLYRAGRDVFTWVEATIRAKPPGKRWRTLRFFLDVYSGKKG